METRANYILIGLFTLAGMVGIMGFLLWFARVELNRQFAFYDVEFVSVSGLGRASEVRFSGLTVGTVTDLRLSPNGAGTIRVRLQVAADTPVRRDSVATIEAQGLTGVAYVGISAGSPELPLLAEVATQSPPRIIAGRSTLQSLSADAPRLLDEALQVTAGLRDLLNPENRDRVGRILANSETASADLAQTLRDVSDATATVTGFATEVGRFNDTLERLGGELGDVLRTSDATMARVGTLADQAGGVLQDGSAVLAAAQQAIAEADRYMSEDATRTGEVLRDTIEELGAQIVVLSEDARRSMAVYRETGTTATARLREAETTLTAANRAIARLDAALGSIDGAASGFDRLLATDGAALVGETRAAVAAAARAIAATRQTAETASTELPEILAEIRRASATVARVVDTVGADLSAASGRIDGLAGSAQAAMDGAAATFARADGTLAAIDGALETGSGALQAAERAFIGADRVINEDVAAITADLRLSLAGLNDAIAVVSSTLPGITGDLGAASRSANIAFSELARIAARSGGPIEAFATTALPHYGRLAQETRAMIGNIDALITRIERDPARFLLDQQAPEFRR